MSDETSAGGVLVPAAISAVVTLVAARLCAAFLRRSSELEATGRISVRVPVYVPARAHAAVYVGSAGALASADDVDDMGLLARAMNASRTAQARPAVASVPQLQQSRDFPAHLFEDEAPVGDEPVRMLATVAAVVAVLLGVPAIVRPLEPWAPALAGAAVVLGACAWWLGRRAN